MQTLKKTFRANDRYYISKKSATLQESHIFCKPLNVNFINQNFSFFEKSWVIWVPAQRRKPLGAASIRKTSRKRLRAVKKTRRQRIMEGRGIKYKDLPEEIKEVVKEIRKARLGRIRGAAFAAVGATYSMSNAPGPEKHLG
jgi:hypothetical protein